MRLLIVTDAWRPQVNGVVRTLGKTARVMCERGHSVCFLTAEGRRTWAVPGYREIRVAFMTAAEAGRHIEASGADAVYIATEGPLGWAARSWCAGAGRPFATGFHTRLPDYAAVRLPLPGIAEACWSLLRRFHARSGSVLAPTASLAEELRARGFARVAVWGRGIDRTRFRPLDRESLSFPRPIALFAGRVAPEKNLTAFLELACEGTKVVVGDGPDRTSLARRYPEAVFTGYKFGDDYVRALSAADVFVFPSRTDTFGLVMIEAMACGTPVAAFDVTSPRDVVKDGVTGAIDPDLSVAIRRALALDRTGVEEGSRPFTWEAATDRFEHALLSLGRYGPAPPAPITRSPEPYPLR